MSRLLGSSVISDLAMIGTDTFFREGAAFGVLLQAKNNFLLSSSLSSQRKDRIKAGGVTEEKLTIAGKEVSFIHSPDGKVRSYYAADGDYHFFTTSRHLVERFLEAAKNKTTLGDSAEFRYARSIMPVSRDDTVFVYFSDAFFRNITSPQYRIEIARRLQAVSDIELIHLARLAARGEGQATSGIAELVERGYLPRNFGPLPDGSRIVADKDELIDSVRGYRGTFIPVPDVPVEKVTAFEAEEYARFVEFYRSQWGRMDPIVVGMKQEPSKDGRLLVKVDAFAAPIASKHFEKLREYAGMPATQKFAPVKDVLASFEFVMTDHRMFGGLCDFGPPTTMQYGRTLPAGRLRDWLVGYIGTDGDLGPLRYLNIGFGPVGPNGFAESQLGGGWRLQFGDYTLFSFQPEVLQRVAPQVKKIPAQRPAQLRINIDDPTSSRLMPMANNWAYNRTRETSLNNIRLMQALEQQLHISAADCQQAAEHLLDGKLICPLGGKYVLQKDQGGFERWTSTAVDKTPRVEGLLAASAPQGFVAPPWNWFRGLKLDAALTEKNIDLHAEVLMEEKK